MKTVTFTYQIVSEKKGFSVKCLDWDSVFSQGESISECKKNAIVVTEMFLEELINKSLHQMQYPKIKKHEANPLQFQCTFDLNTGKYIEIDKIKHSLVNRIKSVKNIAAAL
jgi:predicted RNase H-like HicB family nuclease